MERVALTGWPAETVQALKTPSQAEPREFIFCRDIEDVFDARAEGRLDLVAFHLEGDPEPAREFLRQAFKLERTMPIVVGGASIDLATGVDLMRHGALDCSRVDGEAPLLSPWLSSNLERARERARLQELEREQMCLDIERHQVVSWRSMYASKDVVQVEHLIHEMATTINSSGGYEWLDLLKSMAAEDADGQMVIPRDVYDLILESAGIQRKFFDFITFLSRLDKLTLNKEEKAAVQFVVSAEELATKLLKKYCTDHVRPYRTSFPEKGSWITGYVCQDPGLLERVLRELIINAIKYSPDNSPLVIGMDVDEDARMPILNLWIRNQPKQYQAKDANGQHIVGIPHEYSELVFDLFYTIEAYPSVLPEEEWTDGAGLYIARKLLKRQGAWLSTVNGVDYTDFKAKSFVKFNISIPLHAKRELARCSPKCSPCPFILIKRTGV